MSVAKGELIRRYGIPGVGECHGRHRWMPDTKTPSRPRANLPSSWQISAKSNRLSRARRGTWIKSALSGFEFTTWTFGRCSVNHHLDVGTL